MSFITNYFSPKELKRPAAGPLNDTRDLKKPCIEAAPQSSVHNVWQNYGIPKIQVEDTSPDEGPSKDNRGLTKQSIESWPENQVNSLWLSSGISKSQGEDSFADEDIKKQSSGLWPENQVGKNSFTDNLQTYHKMQNENIFDLNLKNYKDIFKIAKVTGNLALIKECNDFYKVYNLYHAIQFENTELVASSIIDIIKSGDSKWNAILTDLADKYQLADLKLYTSGCKLHIFYDNRTLIVKIPEDPDALGNIQQCLAMNNNWHFPKLELLCSMPNNEMDSFLILNSLLKSGFPASVRIVYSNEMSDLNGILDNSPNIKHLQLQFRKNFSHESMKNIIKLIKENSSLEFLSIIFDNIKDSDNIDNFYRRASKVIKDSQINVSTKIIDYWVDLVEMRPDEEELQSLS